MPSNKFGLYSKNVVAAGGLEPLVVVIDGENGTISEVTTRTAAPAGLAIEDLGDLIIMAGLVDSHVHVNEPGRTEWEGFETATRAAAAGGVTTIADMPLNCHPVTTTLFALQEKLEVVSNKLWVDTAFYGGVVPGNTGALQSMIDAGVVGFKCFLIHSGIHEFPNVTEADLQEAMPILARNAVPLLVHAELDHAMPVAACNPQPEDPWNDHRSYLQFLQSRPRRWEHDAITLMIRLCAQHHGPVHIVHLSSADILSEIQRVRVPPSALPFTVETCPHYLTFAAEEISDGDTRFKCAPPIRERENRELLWSGLRDGTISIIVSDHSPCLPDLKFFCEGDLKRAWGGISSLQFRLPAVWTEAKKRGFTAVQLSEWLCANPADFLRLGHQKGRIAAGHDADLVIWDPDQAANIEAATTFHRHKITPYQGRSLIGKVERTYLRGRRVWENGRHLGTARGKPLLRINTVEKNQPKAETRTRG